MRYKILFEIAISFLEFDFRTPLFLGLVMKFVGSENMWLAPQFEVACVGSDMPVTLSEFLGAQYDPFTHFYGAVKKGLKQEHAGIVSGVLLNFEMLGLLPLSTRHYTWCGNPKCEGASEFKPNKEAFPFFRGYAASPTSRS